MKLLVWAFFFIFSPLLSADYVKPSHIPQKTWDRLEPYFLPQDHHIKKRLDSIFSKRVTSSAEAARQAGFTSPEPRKYSHTVVSKHPSLKGYFVKFYLDKTPVNDAPELLERILGVIAVGDAIDRHGYNDYFEVPKKWIYPLPELPRAKNESQRKNFVLIAEDLGVMKVSENDYWFKTDLISKEILDALYVVLQEVGLNDCIYPFNIPLTKKGKIGFIDTASHHRWPIFYDKLTKFLSPSKQKYWRTLIENNGPDVY